MIRAHLGPVLRDLAALVVIILFVFAISVGFAELADLVQAARSVR